ncbi:hypothetical protein V8B97DRAFT_2020358 [Scleroderma yunnanense]
MFSTLGLFQSLSCPERSKCQRPGCLFSHAKDPPQQPPIVMAIDTKAPNYGSSSNPSHSVSPIVSSVVPAKRPFELSASAGSLARNGAEPPRQRLKTTTTSRPAAPSPVAHGTIGAPVLRVSAAQSQVAIPVRQAMLKNLYDHFVVLYEAIRSSNPTLASEHALRQEEEIYKKSTKLTYRNAVINSIAALKKRPIPDSISHPSVGTEEEVAARIESQKKFNELRLTRPVFQQLVMSKETMKQCGYIVEVPDSEGGSRPHASGQVKQCERCNQSFTVKKDPGTRECRHHWGRPFTAKLNGEKLRVYSCCSNSTDEDGCSWGPHVFYESDARDLHVRHSFSPSRPPKSLDAVADDTALDVVALDCEMIYTTGGLRVARISVVDGGGTEIFDELIRMDDGVDVIDYNTRFSGITQDKYEKAALTLSSARQSLDAFINSQTIIIGHALENDLRTLRIIHHQCIDTSVLFPHRAGRPYRRSLRDLVKEHLGVTIQTGDGSSGHSSVEDSIATLDLVKWYVLNKVRSSATR